MVSAADADVIERGGTRDFSLGDSPDLSAGDGRSAAEGRRHRDARRRDADGAPDARPHDGLHDLDVRRDATAAARCTSSICADCRSSRRRASAVCRRYPGITQDYERTFAALKALPVDIFIGAHAVVLRRDGEGGRAKADPAGPNPFIDPAGYRAMIDARERRFANSSRASASKNPCAGRVACRRTADIAELLVAQRDHRVDAHRAAGRQVAGDERDRRQQQR